MPIKPAWYGKIDDVVTKLRSLPVEWVDRATVESLLGVGRRRAQQILLPCISYRVGVSGLADREALIVRLQSMADEGFYETNRRRKVARLVDSLRKDRIARPRVMVEAPISVLNQRFANLPDGVIVGPGRIVVNFENGRQALEKLLALAMAIGNDFATFEESVQGSQATESTAK